MSHSLQDVALHVPGFLGGRCALVYAAVSRECRRAALGSDSSPSWHIRACLAFGPGAPALAADQATGFGIYVAGAQMLRGYGELLEVVAGSVTDCTEGVSVVVCPVLRCLRDLHIGAQHAIRRAAGAPLEDFIAEAIAERPQCGLEAGEVLLAPGGALSPHVLLVPTEIDWGLGSLAELHRRVFAATRAAGLQSLVMPTLCTGGQGMPAEVVVKVLAAVAAEDLRAHRGEPLHVRVACFERRHVGLLQAAKANEGRAALFSDPQRAEEEGPDSEDKSWAWRF